MFDLDLAYSIVEAERPSKVVLQFQDSLLSESISVYYNLQSHFRSKDIEFFINADSTWGSSADDISAKHVDGQLILFFGCDMTIKNKMVHFIPYYVPISFNDALTKIKEVLFSRYGRKIFLFYESSYFWLAMRLQFSLDNCKVVNSHLFQSVQQAPASYSNSEIISGFCLDEDIETDMDNTLLLYVGSSTNQLTAISGRYPTHLFFHFDPALMEVIELPVRNKLLMERYGRISKVEDCEVIGIIIHSMSMDAEDTRSLISKIESMIEQSGKQFYTFVIGRIDESKLENFPEIDMFCLVSSDSTEIIQSNSKWRRPLVTPFELQVGLGLRPWESLIRADFDILGDDALENNVRTSELANDHEEESHETSMIKANQRMLSVIEGKGSQFFADRSYKGLQPLTEKPNMEIIGGQYGTATSYVHTKK